MGISQITSCTPALLSQGLLLSQEPGLEKLGKAGGFQPPAESICGHGQESCGVTMNPTSEESDCRNIVRSKFIGGAAVESSPSLGES